MIFNVGALVRAITGKDADGCPIARLGLVVQHATEDDHVHVEFAGTGVELVGPDAVTAIEVNNAVVAQTEEPPLVTDEVAGATPADGTNAEESSSSN